MISPEDELTYLRLRNTELRLSVEMLEKDVQRLAIMVGQWRAMAAGWEQVAIAANEKARILEERCNPHV